MKSKAKRKIRKLQKGKIWPSVVLFLFSLMIGLMVIFIEMCVYGLFAFEGISDGLQKEETRYVESIIRKHENGMSYQEILAQFDVLDGDPEAMSIQDKNSKQLASYGEITIDLKGSEELAKTYVEQLGMDESSVTYRDSRDAYDIMSEDELAVIDFPHMLEDFLRSSSSYLVNHEMSLDAVVYTIVYWKHYSLGESGDNIFIKQKMEILGKDLVGGLIIGIASFVLFWFLLTLQFINVIGAINAQRRMAKLLLIDNVTGGANWLAFTNKAQKILSARRNRQTTYALVDLSLLKYQGYCSLHGVEEGEELLEQVDGFLTRWMKRGDFHARVAGGDFSLLLRVPDGEGGRDEIISRVQELMDTMSAGLVHKHGKHGEIIHADKSCGTANYKAGIFFVAPSFLVNGKSIKRQGHVDVERFYINAGMAKASIQEGEDRNIAIYNDEMFKAQLWQQKVEDRMQDALNKEEFQVYVQPKYDPVTEKLVGGEALVRWLSGEDGMIPPGKFIPIFEQTGFVTKLDDYMISHVAKLQRQWLDEGKEIVPISVNVSRAHFAQEDLAEHIRDLVDEYKVPRKYVEIELTESAFFDDKKALLTTVHRLQDYGFDVSMDDFGSGYSSLNSLKDLPLNVLKLDAEFFRGEGIDNRGEIVVSEAISLAKQLNMKIVAEGVEKKEQVEFLAEQKCDMIQGYYFAKPMPADEYSERLSEALTN